MSKTTKPKTTKVAVHEPSEEVAVQRVDWTAEQVQLIKNTVAKGSTDDELKLFLYVAKKTGLDPLAKQIHFVKRSGQMTIQTAIDGYRAIAERTGQLAGIDDPIYETESELPSKATVTVYRIVKGQRVPFTASARWDEYAPQGNQAFMWKKMPYLMLGKCAESLALRKAFPNNLSGIYTNEEMEQADHSVVIDIPKIEPPKDKAINKPENIKISIQSNLIRIKGKENVNAENVHAVVKELTQLDLVEENYKEINNRLAVIVEQIKESKK